MDKTLIAHTDIVLIGGGHAHIEVIKSFGMKPEPGARLTLISKESQTLYSGMLPGLIAGHYQFDDAHIDLRPLTQFADCRFYQDEVVSIDLAKNLVVCRNRPSIRFDLLSIDIGSSPSAVPGDHQSVIPVKPVGNFYEHWKNSAIYSSTKCYQTVGVVGGGAGGVELAFAINHRLQKSQGINPEKNLISKVKIITDDESILPTYPRSAQKHCMHALRAAGIELTLDFKVTEAKSNALYNQNGKKITADHIVWATQTSAAKWPGECGLKTDSEGFIKVNQYLQIDGHKNIFAVGDIAEVENHSRPKSGVFAVRQGPILTQNLRRTAQGKKRLRKYTPQRQVLSLISLGEKKAVGTKYWLAWYGKWIWHLKSYIDRRFINQYTQLPQMASASVDTSNEEIKTAAMRCGGCGSKIGPEILQSALQGLRPKYNDANVIIGLNQPDDAAVVRVPPGTVALHTVDGFRDFLNDPYLFGQVTAVHALSDIYAMGATPQTALALATIPLAVEKIMSDDLTQLMSGVLKALSDDKVELIGGHSCEGPEMSLGLAINGYTAEKNLIRKTGAKNDDALILTKSLGTGVIFAAMMQGKAQSRWIKFATEMMMTSNKNASEIFVSHQASSMTDITGFGLCGHIVEMLDTSDLHASLASSALPILPGALSLFEKGYESSLQASNLKLGKAVNVNTDLKGILNITFDPQTSGGLLATIPQDEVQSCLNELKERGYPMAVVIGKICNRQSQHTITLS